ncbi:ribonuclease H-like domain-containing protein, partial [Tanacetum coccineum]
PNDDGRVFTSNDEGNVSPCSRSSPTSDDCGVNFETSMDDNTTSEGNMPARFNDYVVGSSRKCMLNVAMCNNWDLFQLDINNAFLYGDLSKDVYMTLPHGFDTQKGKVCKLNKSLYSLKQSPRQWNAKLTMALIENGFVQSMFDYSLFTKRSDKLFIALLVYVDEIVITSNDIFEIENFKKFLKSKFQIKDLGKLKYFLSIEVLDNKDGISLSQRKYCLELLHEFGLLAAKHVDTPLPENTTLNHVESVDDPLLSNISKYQKLIGIQINKSGNLKLRAYAESDWARYSAEVEYRSMAFATCEAIWLSNLLGDMGVKDLLPV